MEMFEPSQYKIIGRQGENQQETGQQTSVNSEQPLNETSSDEAQENGYARKSVQSGRDHSGETLNQHAEAGRKGARRIHELIEHGRQYEREHGMKPGRQRLRQLIEEGKLYEQEHGLKSDSKRAQGTRRPRVSQEQLLKTLLQSLLRLAKPVYRSRILELVHRLESGNP
jgi:hypothetical protein